MLNVLFSFVVFNTPEVCPFAPDTNPSSSTLNALSDAHPDTIVIFDAYSHQEYPGTLAHVGDDSFDESVNLTN